MKDDRLAIVIYEAAHGESWALATRPERKAARRQARAATIHFGSVVFKPRIYFSEPATIEMSHVSDRSAW